MRVLVLEDEETNRQLLKAVFSRAGDPRLSGAQILEATTLAEARELMAGQAVDLLILDVRLPDGSGLDLAREIALKRATHGPHVVIMSASVLPADRNLALEAGCDAFLAKPYRPAELIETLGRVLG